MVVAAPTPAMNTHISQPLHYITIMNTRVCVGLVVAAWVGGFVHSIVQLILMLPLPFCGPNILDNFYCDLGATLPSHIARCRRAQAA